MSKTGKNKRRCKWSSVRKDRLLGVTSRLIFKPATEYHPLGMGTRFYFFRDFRRNKRLSRPIVKTVFVFHPLVCPLSSQEFYPLDYSFSNVHCPGTPPDANSSPLIVVHHDLHDTRVIKRGPEDVYIILRISRLCRCLSSILSHCRINH